MPNINGTPVGDDIDVTNDNGTLNGNPQASPVTGINGANGADTITVDNSDIDNTISGSGNVIGGGGNDEITIENGSRLSNQVRGNAGNDTISVSDSVIGTNVRGDDGNDVVTITNSVLGGTVNAGGGNDEVIITGSTIGGNVAGNAGTDDITITGSTVGGDVATGSNADYLILDGTTVGGDVRLGGGADTIDVLGATNANSINGGNGTDVLNLPAGTIVTDNSDPLNPFTVVAGGTYTLGSGTFQLPNGTVIPYASFNSGTGLVCFTRGTMIETAQGPRPIETLCVDDTIPTVGNGPRSIRWIGKRRLDSEELRSNPKLCPVRILAGALGDGLPERDLLVSRQHRMLVRSAIVKRMFGVPEVLIPAVKLTRLPGIYVETTLGEVEYFHLLFDQHEIIFAEGTPSESLFTGPEALKALGHEARVEICTLFPEILDLDYAPQPARLIPPGQRQKQLVARHIRNNKPLWVKDL